MEKNTLIKCRNKKFHCLLAMEIIIEIQIMCNNKKMNDVIILELLVVWLHYYFHLNGDWDTKLTFIQLFWPKKNSSSKFRLIFSLQFIYRRWCHIASSNFSSLFVINQLWLSRWKYLFFYGFSLNFFFRFVSSGLKLPSLWIFIEKFKKKFTRFECAKKINRVKKSNSENSVVNSLIKCLKPFYI